MKFKKNKFFIIENDIYDFDIAVSTQIKYSDLEKNLKAILPETAFRDIEIFDEEFDARTLMLFTGQTIIKLNVINESTIAHEVFHAVSFIMERINCKLTMDSNEAYAYFIGYVTKKIYEGLL